MSKYTADQVFLRIEDVKYSATIDHRLTPACSDDVIDMLREYAAHLAAQAEWPSEEDVEIFCENMAVQTETVWSDYSEDEKDACRKATRAALQSVRPPAVVSDDFNTTAMECVKDIRKHAKQVYDLPLLQQDLRRLANRIERKLSRHAPTKD